MKVHVFASLKEYMPAEIEFSKDGLNDVHSLKEVLKNNYPAAAALLESCRFSTDTELISSDQLISAYDHLYVIPPSSGG